MATLTSEELVSGLGNSAGANKARSIIGCKSKTCQATTGAVTGIASIGKNIWDGVHHIDEYCLNKGQTAQNIGFNIGKNLLNLAGGLGDIVFSNVKSPLQKIQDDTTNDQQQFQQNFQQFVQVYATANNKIETGMLQTIKDVFAASTTNTLFYNEMINEKETIDRIYIIFIFIYLIVLIFYILIE